MSSSNGNNPSVAELQAAIAQLSQIVQQVVASAGQSATVVVVDEATITDLLSQVQADTSSLSALLPTQPASSSPAAGTPAEPSSN